MLPEDKMQHARAIAYWYSFQNARVCVPHVRVRPCVCVRERESVCLCSCVLVFLHYPRT